VAGCRWRGFHASPARHEVAGHDAVGAGVAGREGRSPRGSSGWLLHIPKHRPTRSTYVAAVVLSVASVAGLSIAETTHSVGSAPASPPTRPRGPVTDSSGAR
jgi:hypothetical protein